MHAKIDHPRSSPFWLGLVILAICLIQCSYLVPTEAPPTPLSVEGQVGELQIGRAELLVGERTDIRVGVIRGVGANSPFEYQWSTTGGLITSGQSTCCVSYQAPDVSGTYEIQLNVTHDNQVVQRRVVVNVVAPAPAVIDPEPTSVPTPIPTSTVLTATTTLSPTVESTAEPLADAQAYFERGQRNFIQRDFASTVNDYTKAIELNYEPLYEPFYNRGYTHYIQRDYNQAIPDFTQAIELNYEPLGLPYYNRGNAYYYNGDTDQAIADYTQAIELNHEPLSWLYNSRGLAYRKQSQLDLAIADYTLAIELNHDPLNWPYYNRGNAYADQGAYDQAIADYSEAIRADPSDVNAYYQRGLSYKVLGDSEPATIDFNKVLEIGDDYWRQEAETQLQDLTGPGE